MFAISLDFKAKFYLLFRNMKKNEKKEGLSKLMSNI